MFFQTSYIKPAYWIFSFLGNTKVTHFISQNLYCNRFYYKVCCTNCKPFFLDRKKGVCINVHKQYLNCKILQWEIKIKLNMCFIMFINVKNG